MVVKIIIQHILVKYEPEVLLRETPFFHSGEENASMPQKTLWSGVLAFSIMLVAGCLTVSKPTARSAVIAFSEATSCLFQYDVAQHTVKIASR